MPMPRFKMAVLFVIALPCVVTIGALAGVYTILLEWYDDCFGRASASIRKEQSR